MASNAPRRVVGSSTRERFTAVAGMAESRVMPRVGKIRLGAKAVSAKGKEYPTETDFFACDPAAGFGAEERVKLIARFAEVYGERPPRLHEVYLPSDDLTFTFPHPLQWWGSSDNGAKLLCEGDGERAVRLSVDTGAWTERTCANAGDCLEWNTKKCGLKAKLRIFLPLVTASGYWQIDTGSEIGTGNILEVTNHMLAMFNQLRSIPFQLSREKEGVSFEGKLNPHWILHLWAPQVTLSEMKAIAAKGQQKALAAGPLDFEAPDPDTDVPEEIIPAGVQDPAVDPALLAEINKGYEILGTTEANRLVGMNRYSGREDELLAVIKKKVADEQAAALAKISTDDDFAELL